MDRAIIEIFRSWNWPDGTQTALSKKPSLYRVSRTTGISFSSIYNSWHKLQKMGVVSKVILLPSDSLTKRNVLIFQNSTYDVFNFAKSKVKKLHFLELLHYGHVYNAFGNMGNYGIENSIVVAEFINSGSDLARKEVNELSNILGKEPSIVYSFYDNRSLESQGELEEIGRKIAYIDLSELDIEKIASSLGISYRTAKRKIDNILEKKALIAYPLIDQSVINGFQVALVHLKWEEKYGRWSLRTLLESIPTISERYLLYRITNGTLNLLISYESWIELDMCLRELRKLFSSMIVITRFETHFNEECTFS